MKDLQSRRERRAALLASITPEEQRRMEDAEIAAVLRRRQEVEQLFPMTIDEACAECEVSIEEQVASNPDVNPDDVAHDIVISYQHFIHPAQRREFRERMGFYID